MATANAAIAAVSTRRMVWPREADFHPEALKSSNSVSDHPPSGPNANASGGLPLLSALFKETRFFYF